jgi:hypothetical protein
MIDEMLAKPVYIGWPQWLASWSVFYLQKCHQFVFWSLKPPPVPYASEIRKNKDQQSFKPYSNFILLFNSKKIFICYSLCMYIEQRKKEISMMCRWVMNDLLIALTPILLQKSAKKLIKG